MICRNGGKKPGNNLRHYPNLDLNPFTNADRKIYSFKNVISVIFISALALSCIIICYIGLYKP